MCGEGMEMPSCASGKTEVVVMKFTYPIPVFRKRAFCNAKTAFLHDENMLFARSKRRYWNVISKCLIVSDTVCQLLCQLPFLDLSCGGREVDANFEELSLVCGERCGILLALYLRKSLIGGAVEFQFHNIYI